MVSSLPILGEFLYLPKHHPTPSPASTKIVRVESINIFLTMRACSFHNRKKEDDLKGQAVGQRSSFHPTSKKVVLLAKKN